MGRAIAELGRIRPFRVGSRYIGPRLPIQTWGAQIPYRIVLAPDASHSIGSQCLGSASSRRRFRPRVGEGTMKRRRFIAASAAALALPSLAHAQGLAVAAKPEDLGFSAERLDRFYLWGS